MQKENLIKKTILEWDIIKGLATIFLPFVHTIEIFSLCELINPNDSGICDIISALIIFGPSIFLISFGMKLEKMHDYKLLLRYGRVFLIIGISLNTLRAIIPMILVIAVVGSTADHLISFLFLSDIYLFVGLFYILLGLFRKIRMPFLGIALCSLGFFLLDYFQNGLLCSKIETCNAILGNFVYVDEGSAFPLFSYIIFPILGMLIEKMIENKTQKEIDKMSIIVGCISLTIVVLTVVGFYLSGQNPISLVISLFNETRSGPLHVILVLSLNFIAIVLIRFFLRIIHGKKWRQWLCWLSSNLMVFYLLHWCILTLLCYSTAAFFTLFEQTVGIGIMLVLALIVDIITILVVKKVGFPIMKFILKVLHV